MYPVGKKTHLPCHWCLVIWGKRVNSDDWVDLWPRGSNRTGVDWVFSAGSGCCTAVFFSPVWILRSEMLFQMKRCGEYAEGWGVCVEWLGFVAAGSCMDDTWDWIKSVIYKKPRPLNHIFGGDRILRAWHRGIKNAGPRKRAQGRAQDIPYQSVAPYHHGIWRIFIECSKKPHVRKSAQGRSARGPILPNPLLNARLDRIR